MNTKLLPVAIAIAALLSACSTSTVRSQSGQEATSADSVILAGQPAASIGQFPGATIKGGDTVLVNGGRTQTVNGGVTSTLSGGLTSTVNAGITATSNGDVNATSGEVPLAMVVLADRGTSR